MAKKLVKNKIAIVMPQSKLKESVIDVFKSIKGLNKKMVLSTCC